jgi:hypothetical protein
MRPLELAHAQAINRQLAAARAAESDGALAVALQLVAAAADQLHAHGQPSQYVLEWKAHLEAALGEHARAEASLLDGRRLAERAGPRVGMFRLDLLRAHNATCARDHAASDQLLAGLRGDGSALGPPSPERRGEICRWLRALSFHDRRGQSMAALRIETALILAESWAARGRYRSAHQLVAAFRVELCHASVTDSTIDIDQVRLREAEWLLAAGQLRDAEAKLVLVAQSADPIVRIRAGLLATRLALARGRVVEALQVCSGLVPLPGVPSLFVAVVTAQIAVRVELNQLQQAQDIATAAIERLDGDARQRSHVDLLMRARAAAAARSRSAIARWELPFRPRRAPSRGEDADNSACCAWLQLPDEVSGFSAAWTGTANRILLALEAGELDQAADHQAALERITHGVESDSVAAHVAFCAALVAYYGRGPTAALLDDLAAIADRFERIGCRLSAAQATRFAAWAAARIGHSNTHLELSRRAATAIEDAAGELGVAERLQFLMNKWNGRDELAAALLRSLLDRGAARRPGRRALCRAFRRIDALTHWSIDAALGDVRARALDGASSDVVARWVEDQLAMRAGRRGSFRLRNVLGLWRVPRRTLVLHYHMLGDRTYVFRIAFGHIDLRVLPIGRLQLRDDISHDPADRAALGELAACCGITEALDDFPGIERLVIIPHDAIANVPFAALPIDGSPLCARIGIAQLDRLSRLRRPYPRRRGRFVAIGLDAYLGSGLCDLADAEAEAAVVGRLAAGPLQLLLGMDATITNVLAALPGARGAHISAHGGFDTRRPDEAGIVLHDHGAHRTLSLRELQRLDLRALDLVTMSTCRAAAHATLPGRERICVPTALLDAGARGVIASLWPVDDGTSIAVMSTLYQHLHSSPPSVALARTQAALCHLPASLWAGLIFYGNDWT